MDQIRDIDDYRSVYERYFRVRLCIRHHGCFADFCLFHIFTNLRKGRKITLAFATRVKEFRARYNLTQEDLAKLVNVRRETIIHLEKGKYNPSLRLAHDIARALKTTIEELFYFDENWGEEE